MFVGLCCYNLLSFARQLTNTTHYKV